MWWIFLFPFIILIFLLGVEHLKRATAPPPVSPPPSETPPPPEVQPPQRHQRHHHLQNLSRYHYQLIKYV
jgi:hypothetical protein